MTRVKLTVKRHIVVFLILAAATAATTQLSFAQALAQLTVNASTGAHTFAVEVMRSPEDRSVGLMHRQHLDADRGMLFDFGDTRQVRMWMKNTLIPLDMVFISEGGNIAGIAYDTVPMSTEILSSPKPVRYVLEINAGLSRKLGFKIGDHVKLP